MPVQAAMLLLRVSGIPRLTYLMRVIPPAIIREACENFDAMIMRTVADKCNLPDPATNTNVRRQITLPYRCAGMAFSPHTRSSPAAYYSSMAASAHTISNHSTAGEMEQRLRGTDTAFHLADTHSILLATGVDPALKGNRERLPAEADEFWSFFAGSSKVRPHLQKHLTRLMTNKMYRSDPTPLPLIEAMAAATAAAMSDSGEADAPVRAPIHYLSHISPHKHRGSRIPPRASSSPSSSRRRPPPVALQGLQRTDHRSSSLALLSQQEEEGQLLQA